jgi:hypothetical protein
VAATGADHVFQRLAMFKEPPDSRHLVRRVKAVPPLGPFSLIGFDRGGERRHERARAMTAGWSKQGPPARIQVGCAGTFCILQSS